MNTLYVSAVVKLIAGGIAGIANRDELTLKFISKTLDLLGFQFGVIIVHVPDALYNCQFQS